MNVVEMLVSSDKYNIKCPYTMTPEFITIHNTANDASARNEVAYMIRNDNQVSFHFAIDDVEVVQGIPLNRNAWHSGDGVNGNGNRKSIGIEICYSKSGGDRFIKAEQNCAKFVAQLLKERGWGIDRVKKHQDWSNKYCPHRTLDLGWQRFLNMISSELNSLNKPIIDEKEIEGYKNTINSLNGKISALNDEIFTYKNKLENSKKENKVLSDKISLLEKEVANLKDDFPTLFYTVNKDSFYRIKLYAGEKVYIDK